MKSTNFDNNIHIDFSRFPFCFRCVSVGKYTNKLRDDNQFFEKFRRLFEIDIPALTQYTFDDVVKNTNKHSHTVSTKSNEYNMVVSVIIELYKSYKNNNVTQRDVDLFLENNINDYYLWQLGISGGIRLYGIQNMNVFSVLFIDYHHLIHPDKKHNQENYELYDFCPIENNKNEGGIINE